MVLKRRKYPRLYELVIGTVDKVYDHGAFVKLDEYGGIEAYCPLTEVRSSWFRGIREILKVGQKAVFKVIRVDPRRGHVDVSLKRVSDDERKEKMLEWKRAVHADNLLKIAAEKLGKTLREAYEEAGWKLEDYYGEIYAGLEEAAKRGEEALRQAGLSEEWVKVLYEIAKEHIELPEVKISGHFILVNYNKNGVLAIRDSLLKGLEVAKKYDLKQVRIYAVGAPRYRIDVVAHDYKEAERALSDIVNTVLSTAKELGCEASFEREKRKK